MVTVLPGCRSVTDAWVLPSRIGDWLISSLSELGTCGNTQEVEFSVHVQVGWKALSPTQAGRWQPILMGGKIGRIKGSIGGIWGEQPGTDGIGDGLGAVLHVQFLKDVSKVVFDRIFADG